jgi:DNA recombination protein RmuC
MSAIWLIVGIMVGAAVTALIMRERIRTLRDAQDQMSVAHDRMSDSFKALSAETVQRSMEQLTRLAKSELGTAQAEAKGELEKRQQAVEQLVKPLREQLEKLNDERTRSGAQMTSQIKLLIEAQDRLRTETGALVTALRRPNAAGQWGQMQLRRVVELAGMLEHCDFNEQVSYTGQDDRGMRPDMVINLPGGKQIVVDSKAPPIESLAAAQNAEDAETRAVHLKSLASALRAHIRSLGDKRYWNSLDSTPDFVVLFLPGESLYGAALEADPGLMEEAMSRHVLIATPTTLLALLYSAAYGWQQERITDQARAIAELGRELHGRVARLSSLLQTLGKRINGTVTAYNDTVGSYEARVLPGARRFAEYGAVGAGSELTDMEQVTVSARTVQVAVPEDVRAAAEPDAADGPAPLFDDPAGFTARHLRAAD